MRIRGAVLTTTSAPPPWASSRPIEVRSLELDPPGPGEVLLRLEAAGVCHSDLSRVSGVRECAVPMLLGHEGCGIVEAVGDGVRRVAVGDKVTLTFMPRCGACAACRAPGWSLCSEGTRANADGTLLGGGRRIRMDGRPIDHHGGASTFATHAVVDEHSAVRIPSEIPSDVGALLGCAVLTGGGAVRNAGRLQAGESIAIVGMGGVGQAAALVALGLEASSVVAIDPQSDKREHAMQMGCTAALTPEEAAASSERFDVVLECVGSPAVLESAIALTTAGGRTVTVGLPRPGSSVRLDPLTLVLEARTVVGSYMGSGVRDDDIAFYAGCMHARPWAAWARRTRQRRPSSGSPRMRRRSRRAAC